MSYPFSRRQALRGLILGAAAVPGLSPSIARAASPLISADTNIPGTCTLFPQEIEGPYYFDPGLVRADITEGRPGLPLQLTLTVAESGSCSPLAGARVDIWHADARGAYSGYARQGDGEDISTTGQAFLRGTQIADRDGRVQFRTIYPGWYAGRATHIHIKVFLSRTKLLTGQMYFPTDLGQQIYRSAPPYKDRGEPDTTNDTDSFFVSSGNGAGTVLAAAQNSGMIAASLLVSVDRTGKAARDRSWLRW